MNRSCKILNDLYLYNIVFLFNYIEYVDKFSFISIYIYTAIYKNVGHVWRVNSKHQKNFIHMSDKA